MKEEENEGENRSQHEEDHHNTSYDASSNSVLSSSKGDEHCTSGQQHGEVRCILPARERRPLRLVE